MKIRDILIAAGMVVASVGVGSAAEAQPRHDQRWEQGHHDNGRHVGRDRRRDDRGHARWDRRDRRGWDRRAYHQPRRCWTEWRNHRRIRVCR